MFREKTMQRGTTKSVTSSYDAYTATRVATVRAGCPIHAATWNSNPLYRNWAISTLAFRQMDIVAREQRHAKE